MSGSDSDSDSEAGVSGQRTSVCGRLSFAGRLSPCLHDDGSLLALQASTKVEDESRFRAKAPKPGADSANTASRGGESQRQASDRQRKHQLHASVGRGDGCFRQETHGCCCDVDGIAPPWDAMALRRMRDGGRRNEEAVLEWRWPLRDRVFCSALLWC